MAKAKTPRWLAFIYWVVGLGLIAFGLPEFIAVSNDEDGDAFSEALAWLVDFSWVLKAAFILFMASFTYHITAGNGKTWFPWQKKKEEDSSE